MSGQSAGIEVFKTPLGAPKANAICERSIRSVRRECLDHLFLLGEKPVQRVMQAYVAYFNHERPHQRIGQQISEHPCPPIRHQSVSK
jgi:transposase InsO family protein